MSNKNEGLWRWAREKWQNKKGETGKGSGKSGWRPTVKVSEKTPETWGEMTPSEKRKKTENKRKANKRGGGWSTHHKDRKQVWNTKKSEEYNMYDQFPQKQNYDNTTTVEKKSDYDMYSDDHSECGNDHIHVGPLIIESCQHDEDLHVCIYVEKTGEKIAETEISDHDLKDHMSVIGENMEGIYKAYMKKSMEKTEEPEDDEEPMHEDNLETIQRKASLSEKKIKQNFNNKESKVPEWVEDKISQVKTHMGDVADYVSSQEEMDKADKPFHGYDKKRHSKTGGLNDSYRKKYNRQTGSKLKRPVTGKVKAGSKAAKRRKSFCARMSGVKGPTSKDGKLTPKGAALKRWKCSKSEDLNKSYSQKLEHYSPHENLKQIDPKFKGTGVDVMSNRAYTEHPHSFYYIAGTEPEKIVTQSAKRKYVVNLPQEAKIYDIHKDSQGFKKQVLQENQGAENRDMLIGKIKNAGYHGFTHSGSELPNVVALFHSMPVSESYEK